MKLTKSAIDSFEHDEKKGLNDVRWDDELRGFGVRVLPSGRRTFVVYYRTARGRQRLQALGAYGVLTLFQARDMARQILAAARQGKDPQQEKRVARKRGLTVEAYGAIYLERYCKGRPSYRDDERYMKQRIVPAIGRVRLDEVTGDHVAKLHADISKKTKPTANRVLALLRHMFNQAKKPGWSFLPQGAPNPTEGVGMNAEVKRKRFVTTAEMPKLVEQIQLVPNVFHRVALWTYILTGRRKNEVLRLRWLDYNRKEQLVTWRIKGGRTETTPISGFNAQLIEALPRYSGNPYVFVGKIAKRPIADLRYWWDEVREKAGLEDVRIHDLRHTLVSWVSATGKTSALIASIVGHQDERTTQRYLHFEDAPLKQALDDHATRVRKLVDAEAQKREAAKAASTEVIDVQASEP